MRVRILVFLSLGVTPALAGDERGYLGFRPSFKERPKKGIAVEVVFPGGPAEKAGLKAGDILLKYNGQDVPDAKGYDDESENAFPIAFLKIAEQVKAGAEVELVVERDGKAVTLKAVALNQEAIAPFMPAEEEEEEEGPGEEEEPVKLPDLASAGAPEPVSFDFQKVPEGFFAVSGNWQVQAEAGTENAVLRQDKPVQPWAISLVAGKGRCYGDGAVTVRFMPLSGEEDASGGILFRAQDAKNYYIVRANALENNLRLYVVKDGNRTQLASVTVDPPALKKWHTLEVSFVGPKFKARLDGKDALEATDATFASGWCGLWTKADSVTLFDDFAMKPEKKEVGH